MKREHLVWLAALVLLTGPASGARAAAPVGGLGSITAGDQTSALRTALTQGAEAAVGRLGKADGFLGNPEVKIPLPGKLKDGEKLLRTLGAGKQADALVTAMNRAAEAAVPEAKSLLLSAVKNMSVEDGRQILSGGDRSVTDFFAKKTREPLGAKFLPIVTRATQKVSLADKYNAVAGQAADLGLLDKKDADTQKYVTGKALDGLYLMIGEEERKIRKDPVGTGSAILKNVFGSLK